MKQTLTHIILSALIAVILLACGKADEQEVIPRKQLSRIYAEMLMTDQWITTTRDMRKIADTTLVYEPILMKYGYTSEDYRHTVDVYLNDPERFSRIWRETSKILEKRVSELKKLQVQIEEAERRRKAITTDFDAAIHFPYMHDEPYVHYYDSVSVEMDSLTRSYRLKSIETADTVYDRLVMTIIKDTLAVSADSAEVAKEEKKESVKPQKVEKTMRKLKENKNLPLRQLKATSDDQKNQKAEFVELRDEK